MVALEPSEPLLLYVTAIAEVVSMVLVTERSKPKQPQALKGAPTAGSRSQDPDPAEGPRDHESSESQHRESTLSPKPKIGSRLPEVPMSPKDQGSSGSYIPEPTSGPDSQHTTGSQLPEVPSGPGGQEAPAPEPMEINPPNPPGKVRTVQ
jgi:hypothetical protein